MVKLLSLISNMRMEVHFQLLFLNGCTNLCLQLSVLWKVVEKLLVPKPKKSSNVEDKTPAQGLMWSFGADTNLFSGLVAKIDRESKQKLNEFSKELRSFRTVDMSGMTAGKLEEMETLIITKWVFIVFAIWILNSSIQTRP